MMPNPLPPRRPTLTQWLRSALVHGLIGLLAPHFWNLGPRSSHVHTSINTTAAQLPGAPGGSTSRCSVKKTRRPLSEQQAPPRSSKQDRSRCHHSPTSEQELKRGPRSCPTTKPEALNTGTWAFRWAPCVAPPGLRNHSAEGRDF